MIGFEMQTTTGKNVAPLPATLNGSGREGAPSDVERAFACELATSVWLLRLDDETARAALSAYAMARCCTWIEQARLRVALEREYRLCRERLDLCG